MPVEDWDAQLEADRERERGDDTKRRRHVRLEERWDSGDGPRLSDARVLMTSGREMMRHTKAWLKTRAADARVLDWPLVVGGDGAIDALVESCPTPEEPERTWAGKLENTFACFLLTATYGPNVRIGKEGCSWHAEPSLDLERAREHFERRSIEVLTLADVGLVYDRGAVVHWDEIPEIEVVRVVEGRSA